jgi:hypothetical protein
MIIPDVAQAYKSRKKVVNLSVVISKYLKEEGYEKNHSSICRITGFR